ncbi:MAG: DUF2017 family protein [Actinomycetota bacterium]
MFRRRRFVRALDGSVRVRLSDDDRRVMEWLLPQLRSALVGVEPDGDVPDALRRLFPTAHPDDVDAEADYRGLMRDQLLAGRLDALDRVEATLGEEQLDPEDADLWMGVVNDLRLTIGTVLDVGEDDEVEIDPDDPDAAARFAYDYLTGVLAELVDARMD